jgi:sterol desaturase/sphingolipid hydroxylase (fatty acid hydroxylase superfamily)
MINLFLGIALLLAMILIEILYLKYVEKEEIPWREIIFNLNSGHVMLWVCRGLEVAGFDYVLKHWSFGWVGQWHIAAQWIFTLLAWDFCFYWMHRLHHKFPLLWAVHVVHHEGEHFSLSLGVRNSWYSSLTSFPFFVGLAVLGVPTEQFYLIGAFHYFVQFYNHNRVVNKSGWLEYFIVTPSHHRVHHGCNAEYRDKNCGGTFAFWDMWFGTFQAEREDIEIQYGVKHKTPSDNPFWVNHLPFLFYVFKTKVPDFQVFTKNKKPISEFEISMGGILLFALLIFYIYQEDKWGGYQEIILFALLLGATIAMAGLYENYRWGTYGWLFFVAALVVFMLYFSIFYVSFLCLSLLFALHGIWVFNKN